MNHATGILSSMAQKLLSMMLCCQLTLASIAGCRSSSSDTCGNVQGFKGVDGGLVCGQPFHLNETDLQGNVIGPGVFGVKVVEYVHVNAAGLVQTDTLSVLLFMAYIDLDQAELTIDMDVQLCQIQIPQVDIPGQPEPTIFRTLPEMMPNIPRAPVRGSVSGMSTCDSFEVEPAVTIIGACLEDLMADELPANPTTDTCTGPFDTSMKDSYCESRSGCMYDVDQDGFPAATLEAENVPGLDVDLVFVTMRSWVSLEGVVATSHLLLGTANFDLAVSPFACRLHPLGGGEQRDCNPEEVRIVARINPDITQTPGQDSTFLAVRVPSDLTCEELIENELELFGR